MKRFGFKTFVILSIFLPASSFAAGFEKPVKQQTLTSAGCMSCHQRNRLQSETLVKNEFSNHKLKKVKV